MFNKQTIRSGCYKLRIITDQKFIMTRCAFVNARCISCPELVSYQTEVMIKKNDATRRQQRRWPSCCPGSHTGHNRKGHLTWPESHLRHPVRASIGMVPHDCGIAPPVTTTRVVRALRLYKHLEWQLSTSRLLTWSLGSILLPHGTESCRPHHMEQLCPSNPPTLSGHNFMISC